jgi:CheY-like chemotaxis protein
VLIVDDDAGIRTYVGRCLRPLTGRVCEAEDGIEALSLARASAPDGLALVILDLSMPRMGGLELHAILRTDPAFAAIPVLFISGEPAAVPEGRLLLKPFNARTLRAAVEAAWREVVAVNPDSHRPTP